MEKEERLRVWESYLTGLKEDLVFFSEHLGFKITEGQKHFLTSSKKEASQLTTFESAYPHCFDAVSMPLVLNNLLCGNPETFVVFPNKRRADIWQRILKKKVENTPLQELIKFTSRGYIEFGRGCALIGTGVLSNSNRENTAGLHDRGYDLVLIDPCEESRSWIQFTEDISIDPRKVWSLGVKALAPFPDTKKVNRYYL